MLQSGKHLRFTAIELEEFRSLGLDLGGVRNTTDLSCVLIDWLELVGSERFDLIENLVRAIAAETDIKLPPKLAVAQAENNTQPVEKPAQ